MKPVWNEQAKIICLNRERNITTIKSINFTAFFLLQFLMKLLCMWWSTFENVNKDYDVINDNFYSMVSSSFKFQHCFMSTFYSTC